MVAGDKTEPCLIMEEYSRWLQHQKEHTDLGFSAYTLRKMVERLWPDIPQRAPLLREGRKQTPVPAVRDLVILPPPQALSSVTRSHHTFKVLLTYVPLFCT